MGDRLNVALLVSGLVIGCGKNTSHDGAVTDDGGGGAGNPGIGGSSGAGAGKHRRCDDRRRRGGQRRRLRPHRADGHGDPSRHPRGPRCLRVDGQRHRRGELRLRLRAEVEVGADDRRGQAGGDGDRRERELGSQVLRRSGSDVHGQPGRLRAGQPGERIGISTAIAGRTSPTAASRTAAPRRRARPRPRRWPISRTVADSNPKFILLATDGQPNCPASGDTNSDDSAAAIQVVADAYRAGVPTFVVGIGTLSSTEVVLDALARAGGHPRVRNDARLLSRIQHRGTSSPRSIELNPDRAQLPIDIAAPAGSSRDAIDVLGDIETVIPRDTTSRERLGLFESRPYRRRPLRRGLHERVDRHHDAPGAPITTAPRAPRLWRRKRLPDRAFERRQRSRRGCRARASCRKGARGCACRGRKPPPSATGNGRARPRQSTSDLLRGR